MDQLAKLGPFAALGRLWNELSATQRVVVLAFAALSVVAVVVIGMAASKPRMAVLFSGLESADAGTIVQKLSENKVPYQLSSDGGTIEVPADKVYDLRLQMATQGLPQGGSVGFELFDKTSFGMTEFTERLNYQRAIQGELTRSICQLAPVISARVHLALPEDKLYSSDQEPATASVVLKLRRGMPLTDGQVGGIVHLIASAVEGLKPSNVNVIDSDGNALSEAVAGSGEGGGLLTTNQAKLKRQYETELAQNIQSMLVPIVGQGNAVVRISADMSFDRKQTKSESYEPASSAAGAQGVLLSEEKKTETYNGGVLPPSGIPGGVRIKPVSSNDSYSQTQSSSQYQVTKKIEEVVSAPGQVNRLSVAVLIDDKVDPAKAAAIQEAVRAAAGIDDTRKDQITVQRVAFDTASKKAEAAEMAKASKTEMIQTIGKNAAAVLLLVAFLFFLRTIVKQIKVSTPTAVATAPAVAAPVVMAPPTDMSDLLQGVSTQSFTPPVVAPQPTPENYSTAPAAEGLPREVTQSSPEDLARLVRSWMSEQ